MLFETSDNYKVVESKSFGLLQHDAFTWLIEGDEFVYVKGLYGTRRFADDTLNEWVQSLNDEQRRLFVDTLYQVVAASKTENLIDFSKDLKKSMNRMIAAAKEVDRETKRMLKKSVKQLFRIALGKMGFRGFLQKRAEEQD